MRTLIIHNPKSGFGSDAVYQFQRSVVRPGDECVFRLLKDDFDPREAVRDATDFDVVVASGGDGTVSGVMHALAGTGVPVCAFPSGTANLFNANLGNTPEPQSLARACRMGQVAGLDLGSLNWVDVDGASHERGFALMSGTGYDAQLMQAALPNKALMGEAAYYAAALANPRPDVVGFRITVDGQTYEREGIMCLVANAAMIQGDVQIVPDCRMDDGALDVIVVEVGSVAQLAGPVLFAPWTARATRSGARTSRASTARTSWWSAQSPCPSRWTETRSPPWSRATRPTPCPGGPRGGGLHEPLRPARRAGLPLRRHRRRGVSQVEPDRGTPQFACKRRRKGRLAVGARPGQPGR